MKKKWNKRIMNIIIVFTIAFMISVISFYQPIYAASLGLGDLEDLDKYGQISAESTHDDFRDKVGIFIEILRIVGSLAAVICLIILGIRYMMESVEEKAEYKKTLLPYFIGAIMVLGLGNLLAVVYKVVVGSF